MNEARCPSTRLTGEHCTLEAGHAGSHIQVFDNIVAVWGNGDSAHGSTSTMPITRVRDSVPLDKILTTAPGPVAGGIPGLTEKEASAFYEALETERGSTT